MQMGQLQADLHAWDPLKSYYVIVLPCRDITEWHFREHLAIGVMIVARHGLFSTVYVAM